MRILKVLHWLIYIVGGAFLSVWVACVLGFVQTAFTEKYRFLVIVLPCIILISLACIICALIAHEVYEFNPPFSDDEDADKSKKIPKLFQWLIVGGAFMSVWLSCVLDYVQTPFTEKYKDVVIVLPLYLLISFACFSLALIGYRVATFNDCFEASEELKQQIEEATTDLKKKGFKFKSSQKKGQHVKNVN